MTDRFYFGELQHAISQAAFKIPGVPEALARIGIFNKDIAANQVLLATGPEVVAAFK